MIGKLRKKFILVNMLFVCTILLAVLTILCANSYRKNREGSVALMRNMLEDRRPMPWRIDKKKEDNSKDLFHMIPVWVVELDAERNLKEVLDDDIPMEEELVLQLSEIVLNRTEKEGSLPDYNLRYMMRKTDTGYKIVFMDKSYEIVIMRSLYLQCGIIFVIGVIAFFILSLFLSKWALRPVEHAWEQQTQFVADASHELKTPLTVILANLGILESHRDSTIQDQIKWLQNTKDEATRMKQLVEQLLFLARSDSSVAPSVLSEVDFSNMVWSCLLPFEPLAFEQKLELQSQIDSDLKLLGNEGQLKQLAAILFDNAFKYAGEKGQIDVKVWGSGEKVFFQVCNTGLPISDEDREHIFERFYRADKSRARNQGGYGLGLAIAKTIVDRHGGKITVESSKERGTSFLTVFTKL